MQRTLFFYIFKDLLKVFLLASGALAGIMSFGGLLRPLTQRGLDLGQVGQMLAYFMPAMTNYSWPIAALFAATFVYGRLSSDNELVACRAAGLSYVNILLPAALLGTIVTLCSAAFLAWVVPHSFLKVEQVVYSNLAKLVAGEIERTQRINLSSGTDAITIFARQAAIDDTITTPRMQKVVLSNVVIVKYARSKDRNQPRIPLEFYTADSADAFIEMPEAADADIRLFANLTHGEKIPATLMGELPPGIDPSQSQVSARIETSSFGPFPYQSQIRESTKFMDVLRLLDVRAHPEKSRQIKRHMADLIRDDQQRMSLDELTALAESGRPIVLTNGTDAQTHEVYTINGNAAPGVNRARPRVRREGDDRIALTLGTVEQPGIDFRKEENGVTTLSGKAREIVLSITPDPDERITYTRIEVRDTSMNYEGQTFAARSREFNVPAPMTERVAAIADKTANQFYYDGEQADRMKSFRVDFSRQQNRIEAELHSRFGFAFSCFILSMVGATIGMMTRSGNFVSAFAVSVGPALIAIVLIVTGQHICETPPHVSQQGIESPLQLGLSVLWAGPALVIALGLGLFYKVSRT